MGHRGTMSQTMRASAVTNKGKTISSMQSQTVSYSCMHRTDQLHRTMRLARLTLRYGSPRKSSGFGSGSVMSRRLMLSCGGSTGRGPRRSTT